MSLFLFGLSLSGGWMKTLLIVFQTLRRLEIDYNFIGGRLLEA
jgi:hypothetical protein